MRWIHKLTDLFKVEEVQEITTEEILFSFEDPTVRKLWLQKLFLQIIQINRDIDLRLLKHPTESVTDLAFKRQALQQVLEAVLEARRQVKGYNPQTKGEFDLESVAVRPV